MKQLERERQMIQILEAIQTYGNVSQAAEALFMTQRQSVKSSAIKKNSTAYRFSIEPNTR